MKIIPDREQAIIAVNGDILSTGAYMCDMASMSLYKIAGLKILGSVIMMIPQNSISCQIYKTQHWLIKTPYIQF